MSDEEGVHEHRIAPYNLKTLSSLTFNSSISRVSARYPSETLAPEGQPGLKQEKLK